MRHDEVREIIDSMVRLDPQAVDRDELGVLVALNARLKSYTAWIDLRCSRRADELSEQGRSESGFGVLLVEGNGSSSDAKHAGARDRVCGELPGFEDALAAGAISGEHLDMLARHTEHLTDTERNELQVEAPGLIDAAVRDSASLFERDVKNVITRIRERTQPGADVDELEQQRAQSKVKRWTEPTTGLKHTLISLDPVRDSQFHAVVDAQLARLRHDAANKALPFEQLRVNAVLAAVSATGGQLAVPEIVIHTDGLTACTGRHVDSTEVRTRRTRGIFRGACAPAPNPARPDDHRSHDSA